MQKMMCGIIIYSESKSEKKAVIKLPLKHTTPLNTFLERHWRFREKNLPTATAEERGVTKREGAGVRPRQDLPGVRLEAGK